MSTGYEFIITEDSNILLTKDIEVTDDNYKDLEPTLPTLVLDDEKLNILYNLVRTTVLKEWARHNVHGSRIYSSVLDDLYTDIVSIKAKRGGEAHEDWNGQDLI